MNIPRPLPPLQVPSQLLGTVEREAFGGPLDGELLRVFKMHFVAAVYRAPSRDLWVCVSEPSVAHPEQRAMATGMAQLLGYYVVGTNRRGAPAFAFHTRFSAAARAALAVTPPQVPPPPTPLLPSPAPLFIGVAGVVFLTDETRRLAPRAFGADLARYVSVFLRRPPRSFCLSDAELSISAIYRWLDFVGVDHMSVLDRARAVSHAEHNKDHPACGVVARRILDLISTWESIHGDDDPAE